MRDIVKMEEYRHCTILNVWLSPKIETYKARPKNTARLGGFFIWRNMDNKEYLKSAGFTEEQSEKIIAIKEEFDKPHHGKYGERPLEPA